MTTEAPLFKDGAQTQAAANLYNPGVALNGPGGSGQFLAVTLTASRTVNVIGTQGAWIYGILQNTPTAGQPADIATTPSLSKAVAGAAVPILTANAGTPLMTDNTGRLIPWVAGAANYIVAYAVEAAAAINNVFLVQLVTPTKVLT